MAKRGTTAASSNTTEKNIPTPNGTRQQYWIESAQKLGLVDTEDGIRCITDHHDMDQKRSHSSACTNASENDGAFKEFTSNRSSKRKRRTIDIASKFDTPVRSKVSPAGSKTMTQKSARSVAVVSPPIVEETETRPMDPIRLKTLSSLVGESELVNMDDVDLVPDYLLIAIAQMTPCLFEEWDRVGCYKDRPHGFKGLCCKYCLGQQGHGKFFPASIGGIAQTTTAQTILKHMAYKCEQCPDEVRQAVLKFEDDQTLKESSKCPTIIRKAKVTSSDSKPRYGARKVFFQRLWSRLHDGESPSSSSVWRHSGMLNGEIDVY
jgi:hypothetical protein